jgi:hypothetical protein
VSRHEGSILVGLLLLVSVLMLSSVGLMNQLSLRYRQQRVKEESRYTYTVGVAATRRMVARINQEERGKAEDAVMKAQAYVALLPYTTDLREYVSSSIGDAVTINMQVYDQGRHLVIPLDDQVVDRYEVQKNLKREPSEAVVELEQDMSRPYWFVIITTATSPHAKWRWYAYVDDEMDIVKMHTVSW